MIAINIPSIKMFRPSLRVERWLIGIALCAVSVFFFIHYYQNGLGLAYNDARSHLDIGRRVVEGLKPGLAQLGSVWLPLPHLLMVVTIWNDFMWHSGLAGAIISMISFVATGLFMHAWLSYIRVGMVGRLVAVFLFAANINILYLQSTAMTELLLMATMMGGSYYLLRWHRTDRLLDCVYGAAFVMLSTLIRYEGWFLLMAATILIAFHTFRKKGYRAAEGMIVLFCTLAGFGIFLWLLWNQLIFQDAFYFAFGPFSAHAQQEQLEQAGVLLTKGNMLLSMKIYLYALAYNAGAFSAFLATVGAFFFWFNKKIHFDLRVGALLLLVPIAFNITALYLGHSVLFIQGLSGDTWFNVRYGAMAIPAVAILAGYLVHRFVKLRLVLIGLLALVTFFSITSQDAVTIDDARVGSSQKNVSEVSGYLHSHAMNTPGFILVSAASHDAIIFSSGLPMKRFIHEGTGAYWDTAITVPDRWARWIIMRTHDDNDLTYRSIKNTPGLQRYRLLESYPFADIYELKEEYVQDLNMEANLGVQR